MSELFNKLLILRTPKIGAAKYNDLVRRFGGADAAAASLNATPALRDAVLREMDRAASLGIKYLSDTDAEYPDALRRVTNHPPVISVRGNIETLRRPTVAMVGTRHSTGAGIMFMADLAYEFAARGFAVASGLAMGTDSAAHRGALRAPGNANTIAVVAGGVDYIWPPENESLYYEIISRGVVISEMPVGVSPTANHFVMRNQWIAGVADRLILGEADLKSGSITTARFAIEYGRDVWAIPSHPSDSRAAGPNSLIATGAAHLCRGISDFFETDSNSARENKKTNKNDDGSDSLLDKLGMVPMSETVLTQIVKKPISEIKRELVVLELRGLVRKIDGGYVRA